MENPFDELEQIRLEQIKLAQTESKRPPTCSSDGKGSTESLRSSDCKPNIASTTVQSLELLPALTAPPPSSDTPSTSTSALEKSIEQCMRRVMSFLWSVLSPIRNERSYANVALRLAALEVSSDRDYKSRDLQIFKTLIAKMEQCYKCCERLDGRYSLETANENVKMGVEGIKTMIKEDMQRLKNEAGKPTDVS